MAKKFAPWKSDPELGMVIRDYVEVDEDGRMLTEVRRHDFGDVAINGPEPAHGTRNQIGGRGAMVEPVAAAFNAPASQG